MIDPDFMASIDPRSGRGIGAEVRQERRINSMAERPVEPGAHDAMADHQPDQRAGAPSAAAQAASMTTPPSAPSPAAIADAMRVAELGGDVARLALVCEDQAKQHEGIGRQRLLDAAAAMRWTALLMAALDAQEPGAVHAGG